MYKPRYSVKTLLLVITCAAVVMFFVNREAKSTRGRFRRMHNAAVEWEHRYWGPLFDSSAMYLVRPQFEKKIHSTLLPFLSRFPQPLPVELREYLETSMPVKDFISYQWTYLSADRIAELLGPEGLPYCLDKGYFPFAYSDSLVAAISIHDGKVYCSYGFEDEDQVYYEAESIKEFLEHSRKSWSDDTSTYPLNSNE